MTVRLVVIGRGFFMTNVMSIEPIFERAVKLWAAICSDAYWYPVLDESIV